jgi:hypothetical protein
MNHVSLFGLISVVLLSATLAFGQGPRTVLARGQPPLTQGMVDQLESVYDSILDIKLNLAQRERFQRGLINYWTTNNTDGISGSLTNLKYYGQPDELNSLRSRSQKVIVESLRRDIEATNDDVSKVLVEPFDAAHSELRGATRAKTFSDLVGVWKSTDFLLADKNAYGGGQIGAGYTDTAVLEIKSDGSYKLIKVHNHYASGCSRMDGSTESGTVSANGTNMIFQVKSGTTEITDGCLNRNSRSLIKPSTKTFPWSIRPNPDKENIQTLCISTDKETAVCYEKQ